MNLRVQSGKRILQVGGADPFILRTTDGWWLFTSHDAPDNRRIPIYHSTDLHTWTFVRGAVAQGPRPDSWNRRNFWAPEVAFIDGRYHLYYTAMPDGTPENEGNRVGLAVADHPAGPYEDRGVVIPHASIDGSPYRHRDGSWWLYFTVEFANDRGLKAGQLGVHRLVAPDRIEPDPRILIDRHHWQEGPCILPCGEQLLLLYSTGDWRDGSYAVCTALGASPDGTFTPCQQNLLATADGLIGPGHCNIFPGPDDRPWLVYHAWDSAHTARYPYISPLEIAL